MSRLRTKAQRTLIILLAKASGKVHVYTLHRRARLTPAVILEAIGQLQKLKLIELDGDSVSLSEVGSDWVVKNRWLFASSAADRPWRRCPEEFVAPTHSPSRPVTPRISLLDPKRFCLVVSKQSPKHFHFINQFRAEVRKS